MTCASQALHLAIPTDTSGAPLFSFPHFTPRNKYPVCSVISNILRFSLSWTCSVKASMTTPTCGVLEGGGKGTGFGATYIWVQILAMPLVVLLKFLNILFPHL